MSAVVVSRKASRKQGKSKMQPPAVSQDVRRAFAKHERGGAVETDTRTLTYYSKINTTTGATLGGAYSTGLATSATEFSTMAQRFQEFRVLGMKVKWCPRFGVPSNESCNVDESGQPVGSIFTSGVAPSGVAAMFACDGFRVAQGPSKYLEITADHRVNVNSLLWTGTTGAPAAANQYGIQFRHPGPCPANLNNRDSVDVYVEFVVEFRTAQ